ncbi:MAG: hypothetical protein WDW36_008393 [Sanguina aurantia]
MFSKARIVSADDKTVLNNMRKSLGYPAGLYTWDSGSYFKLCSGWHGVGCNPAGQVSSLNLTGLDISAPFPATQITNLPALTSITFQGLPGMVGTIPKQLEFMSQLVVLNLAGSSMTGPLPPQLSYLTGLKVLELGGMRLSGPLPAQLSILKQLSLLDVGSNALTGVVPQGYSRLTRLTSLNLEQNQLSGSLPASMSSLFKVLQVAGNPGLCGGAAYSSGSLNRTGTGLGAACASPPTQAPTLSPPPHPPTVPSKRASVFSYAAAATPAASPRAPIPPSPSLPPSAPSNSYSSAAAAATAIPTPPTLQP